jgi:hypothetical protein
MLQSSCKVLDELGKTSAEPVTMLVCQVYDTQVQVAGV